MHLVYQPGVRYCRTVALPPPRRTSRPSAASLAPASAVSMPSVMKWKTVPPSISSDGRAWFVRTKTGGDRAGFRPTSPSRIGRARGPAPARTCSGRGSRRRYCRTPVRRNPRQLSLFARHPLKGAGRQKPFVQRLSAPAQRIIEALVGPGAVSIERNPESMNTKLGHGLSPELLG